VLGLDGDGRLSAGLLIAGRLGAGRLSDEWLGTGRLAGLLTAGREAAAGLEKL